jgi:hypothetical protein
MNTGQIVKSKSTERFTTLPNELIKSNTLSLDEKGLLSYLLSLPSDWVIYRKNLYNNLPDKPGTIDRAFKGLQEKGYVISIKVNDKSTGRFIGWNHIVYDIPTDPDNYRPQKTPTSEITDLGKSAYIQKTNVLQNKDIIQIKELEFITEEWKKLWSEWMEYKKLEHNNKFKSAKTEQTAINNLVYLSDKNLDTAKKIVNQSISNNYKGLFKLKITHNETTKRSIDFYSESVIRDQDWINELDKQRGF